MTLSGTTGIGTWLALKTESFALYAPFSYFLASLFILLVALAIIWIWRSLFSVTKMPTFYEAELDIHDDFSQSQIRNIKKQNIKDILIEKDERSKLFHIYIIFKVYVKEPIVEITNQNKIKVSIIASNCNYNYVKFELKYDPNGDKLGTFRIDFNDAE